MPLRQIGKPVTLPRVLPKAAPPAAREMVRKPEPTLRQIVRPGLDAPAKEDDGEGHSSTTSLRMSPKLNGLVETIMQAQDCRKSDAIKYAIKAIGYALQHPEASITVTTAAGETEVTPLMRNGRPV